jgi:hypothetical protein
MNMKKPKYKPGDTVRLLETWQGPPLIPRGTILTVDSYSGAYVYAKGPNQMGKMPFFVVTFETFTERVQE